MSGLKVKFKTIAPVPSEDEQALFRISAYQGNFIKVKEFLAKYSDEYVDCRDKQDCTALLKVCAYYAGEKIKDMVVLLLDHGANMEAKDNFSSAPALFCAAGSGKKEIVDLLIERGANTRAVNGSGEIVTQVLRSYGDPDMAEFIEKKKMEMIEKELSVFTKGLPRAISMPRPFNYKPK